MRIDETDDALESLLRSPPLREPAEDLDARVLATLASHRLRQSRRVVFHRVAIAAGIVIAIGIGVRLSLPRPHQIAPPTAIAQANPIRIERDTSTVYDDGIIAGGDAAYQKYRRRTVREIWYIDPATHAQVQMTIPTEEVIIEKMEAY